MQSTSGLLESAGGWLIRSGIQEANGGVARYYRTDLKQNARISTEITGYAVSATRFIHRRVESAKTLDPLIRAALFLVNKAWDSQLAIFPFEYPAETEPRSTYAYFFDSGIVVRGLLAAWRTTHDRRFVEAAIAGGESMLRNFHDKDGFHPILLLPEKQPLPYEPRWSASPGCYQLKSALAWYQLYEETANEAFRDAWEECLDISLRTHQEFLPGDADAAKVMDRLHAYCYFLEGLFPVLDRQPCVRALSEGIDRIEHFLRQIAPIFERSDVYAQLLRLRIYAATCRAVPLDHSSAEAEAAAAASFEITSNDPRAHGAFCFGGKNGELLPFANPVSTAFCLEALTLWNERENPAFRLDWRDLI